MLCIPSAVAVLQNVSSPSAGSHCEQHWHQPQSGLLPAVAVSRGPQDHPHLAEATHLRDAQCSSLEDQDSAVEEVVETVTCCYGTLFQWGWGHGV